MSRHKQAPELEPSLTLDDVSAVLKVSKPTLYRLMQSDPDFETYLVGGRRRMRRHVLSEWIRKQEEKARVA